MRPLLIDETAAAVSGGSLLLLDMNMSTVRWTYQLIANASANIRSKRGISLPTKLWIRILDFAAGNLPRSFCLVQAGLVSSEPGQNPTMGGGQEGATRQVLRCKRVEFDPLKYIKNAETVDEVEDYIRAPAQYAGEDLSLTQPPSGGRNTFYIQLDSSPDRFVCLYTDIDVPDFISRIEGGNCWACSGSRWICPGCGGVGNAFDVFACCSFSLACPLCMGLGISHHHKDFLQMYDQDRGFEREKKEMEETLERRLAELGYRAGTFVQRPESSDSDSDADESGEPVAVLEWQL